MTTIPQLGSPIASSTDPAGVNPHADTDFDRSTDMNLMHENLARVQMSARLGEAHERRRGYQLSRAAGSAARPSRQRGRRASPSRARCENVAGPHGSGPDPAP